jgi:hypothetical protein
MSSSVGLYDNAIVENLREITQDTRINIVPVENVFRTIGKLEGTEDHIQLPIISVTRTGWSLKDAQHSRKFEGATLAWDKEKDWVQNIQFMPIQINYLLDVWTRTREENDDIMRELIFYYTNHPTLQVDIPFNAHYTHNFNIFFMSDIEDNSDIVEQKNRGEYFRQTIAFYTDDAYLWKTSSRPFTKVIIEVKVEDYESDTTDNSDDDNTDDTNG